MEQKHKTRYENLPGLTLSEIISQAQDLQYMGIISISHIYMANLTYCGKKI